MRRASLQGGQLKKASLLQLEPTWKGRGEHSGFTWSRDEALQGCKIKYSSLMTHTYLSTLHFVVELHLFGLHRKKLHRETSGGTRL